MSFLESLIGNAATTGQGIIASQREQDQRTTAAKDLATYNQELELQRQKVLAEMTEASNIRTEGRGIVNRATERAMAVDEAEKNAPRVNQINSDKIESELRAKNNPEIQALITKNATQALTAEEQAKLNFYKNNEATILGQKRKLAQAGDIDHDAGLRGLRMQDAQLTLDEKKKASAMMTEYETTKDPARRFAIREALVNRGIIKAKDSEFDTEKVTTEKMNPDGTTSKTEHTQKRRATDGKETGATTKQTEQQAHEDARRAVKTGDISEVDANKRLKAAGFNALGDVTAKASTAVKEKQETTATSQQLNKPLTTLEKMESDNLAALKPLADKVEQAKTQLAAAAKSGDPDSLGKYARELQRLRGELQSQADAKFGNGAEAALKKLN